MKDVKVYIIECRSIVGDCFYFGGPDHSKLFEFIKRFGISFTTWRDIPSDYFLKTFRRAGLKKKFDEAKEKNIYILEKKSYI